MKNGKVEGSDEPLIHDVEIARGLGYAEPRKIRELIEKHLPDLGAICARPAAGRGLFRGETQATQEVTEYHLTEAQELFVSAKSETAFAVDLLKELIRVYLLARRGHVPGSDPGTERRRPCVASEASKWKKRWQDSLTKAVCKLYDLTWERGTIPKLMWEPMSRLYKILLSPEVYAAMHVNRDKGNQFDTLHQLLTPDAAKMFEQDLRVVEGLARTSEDKNTFWHRVNVEFKKHPLQIGLFRMPKKPNNVRAEE